MDLKECESAGGYVKPKRNSYEEKMEQESNDDREGTEGNF